MGPRVNEEWTSSEVEEARSLVARLSSSNGGVGINGSDDDKNKKHNDIVDELQAWFPVKTTRQVTDLYVDLVVEMHMAQWQQEEENRLHHAASGGSSDSTGGSRGAWAMSDLVKDNFGVPEEEEEATMGSGDGVVFGFPSEEMRYVEMEQVPPAVMEEKKIANHQPVVAPRAGRFWTTEEHRLFLRGLRVYGRGDWKNIAKYFVTTRTPVQVSSHAQKYFRRQEISRGASSAGRQRYSINDVGLHDADPWAPAAAENSFSTGWQALAFAGGAVHPDPSFRLRAAPAPVSPPPPPPFITMDDLAQLWSPLLYSQLQVSEQQVMVSAAAPMEGAGNFVPAACQQGPAAAACLPADQWMMNNNMMQ